MGYCMAQNDCVFFISKENKEAALQAIKALEGKETCETHYSWVTTENFLRAETLSAAMKAWRWVVDENDNGDIDNIEFSGEKIGDDEILFAAIAPFVKAGSYIEMQGEDGALWRWVFNGKEVADVNSKIVWEYPDGWREFKGE